MQTKHVIFIFKKSVKLKIYESLKLKFKESVNLSSERSKQLFKESFLRVIASFLHSFANLVFLFVACVISKGNGWCWFGVGWLV